jgi:hypothetical protein
MRRLVLCVALLALGCGPQETEWEEGEIGVWQPGLSVGAAGGCSTFIADGLSKQLIAEQNCIRPGALSSFKGAANLSLGGSVYPFLQLKARDALVAAAKSYGTISINSAFRTLAQQYLLYKWYQAGQCGIGLAAKPGSSNHETGIALDVGNYSGALSTLGNHGFTHPYPGSDPVHFDYKGSGTMDLRSESVLAFQRLWNLNNPGDQIAEDGAYGPMTAARVSQSPTEGFAKGATCTPQSTPSDPPNPMQPPVTPEWAAQLTNQSSPPVMLPGREAPVWVELKNVGTRSWTPGKTFLGTVGPQDRSSALQGPGWIGPNRPATVEKATAPGEVGRFRFTIVAPEDPMALTESFGLVEEGVAWFDNVEVTIELEVLAIVPHRTAAAPPTGGSDVHGGCSMGGGAGGAPLLTIVIIGLMYGRRRRRDVP